MFSVCVCSWSAVCLIGTFYLSVPPSAEHRSCSASSTHIRWTHNPEAAVWSSTLQIIEQDQSNISDMIICTFVNLLVTLLHHVCVWVNVTSDWRARTSCRPPQMMKRPDHRPPTWTDDGQRMRSTHRRLDEHQVGLAGCSSLCRTGGGVEGRMDSEGRRIWTQQT